MVFEAVSGEDIIRDRDEAGVASRAKCKYTSSEGKIMLLDCARRIILPESRRIRIASRLDGIFILRASL